MTYLLLRVFALLYTVAFVMAASDQQVESKVVLIQQPGAEAESQSGLRPQPSIAVKGKSWRSCGCECDPRALLFFSQLTISLLLLMFCISQIATIEDSQWAKMTLTFIIGVWLPSPRANK